MKLFNLRTTRIFCSLTINATDPKLQIMCIFSGITPSNEIRDPPKYVRHVTSEPLDDDAFYRAYHEEFCDDDSSDTRFGDHRKKS